MSPGGGRERGRPPRMHAHLSVKRKEDNLAESEVTQYAGFPGAHNCVGRSELYFAAEPLLEVADHKEVLRAGLPQERFQSTRLEGVFEFLAWGSTIPSAGPTPTCAPGPA